MAEEGKGKNGGIRRRLLKVQRRKLAGEENPEQAAARSGKRTEKQEVVVQSGTEETESFIHKLMIEAEAGETAEKRDAAREKIRAFKAKRKAGQESGV